MLARRTFALAAIVGGCAGAARLRTALPAGQSTTSADAARSRSRDRRAAQRARRRSPGDHDRTSRRGRRRSRCRSPSTVRRTRSRPPSRSTPWMPSGLTMCVRHLTATSGSGTPGTWEGMLAFPPEEDPLHVTLRAYTHSPKDGSMVDLVEYPDHRFDRATGHHPHEPQMRRRLRAGRPDHPLRDGRAVRGIPHRRPAELEQDDHVGPRHGGGVLRRVAVLVEAHPARRPPVRLLRRRGLQPERRRTARSRTSSSCRSTSAASRGGPRPVLTGAMRAIWKGALTFGLVNVPVKVYSATEDHDVSLHQVHNKDGGRIRYQRKCEVCGEIVAVPGHRQGVRRRRADRRAHRRRPGVASRPSAAARSTSWSSCRASRSTC